MIGGANGQRFISSIISAVSVNPSLSECEHASILSAALLGESLNLSPSPQLGHYYMVPFNDKKNNKKTAVFTLGYKGLTQLAIRSGYYKHINVLAIKEGELEQYNELTENLKINLIEDDLLRDKTPTAGYYAMFELTNGFTKAMYWSKRKMEAHADRYSAAFSLNKYQDLQEGNIPQSEMWKYSSFWYKDFDSMALKTMLRQLISKWGIMSVEFQTAFERDDAVIGENNSFEYVNNIYEDSVEFVQNAEQEPIEATVVETDVENEFFDK